MTSESKSTRFSPEMRERAVRMVAEHRGDHTSEWAAITSIGDIPPAEAEAAYYVAKEVLDKLAA